MKKIKNRLLEIKLSPKRSAFLWGPRKIRNIPAFAEFLNAAALTSGELLNYSNIGRETGVCAKVVRNYFQILEDTLLGFRIQPWQDFLAKLWAGELGV